jgi:hypothetical protein
VLPVLSSTATTFVNPANELKTIFIPFVSFLTVPYVLHVDRSDWEDVLICYGGAQLAILVVFS